jgi:putative DNA primase/helicase
MQARPITELAVRADAGAPGCDTEDALAQEFAKQHGRDFRYVPGYGYMVWMAHRWARDSKRRHFDAMRKIARSRAAEADKAGESRRIAAAKTVAAMASLASSDPLLVRGVDELDADPFALNTPGGIVDLRTGEIRSHDRDLVTRVCAVTPDLGGACPRWLRFLDDVFEGNADVIGFVRRFLGYCLTGLTREHVLGFFFGDGANGKSTLLDFLLWLLGDYALKLPASVLMAQRGERHPTELAQLVGVRMAVASELDEGEHWAEARLKELTGDATLTARFVRGDFFTFALLCKIVIAGNHRPQMRAVDDALKRRLLLVPFNAKFMGQRCDPQMLDHLKAEGPGALGWMIQGCAEWLASGLHVPDCIREASATYITAMDSLGNWLAECCRVTNDPADSEGASVLYRSYADWKRGRGENAVSQTRLSEQLRTRGFESYRNNGIRYRGLELSGPERLRMEAASGALWAQR